MPSPELLHVRNHCTYDAFQSFVYLHFENIPVLILNLTCIPCLPLEHPKTNQNHSVKTISKIEIERQWQCSLGQGNWSPMERLNQWFLSRRWIEEALNRKSTSRLFERNCFLSFLCGICNIRYTHWNVIHRYTGMQMVKWYTAVP